jgi:hypothetical protein
VAAHSRCFMISADPTSHAHRTPILINSNQAQ